jgi:hypothetical protein
MFAGQRLQTSGIKSGSNWTLRSEVGPSPRSAQHAPATSGFVRLVYLHRVTPRSRAVVALVLLSPLIAVACRTYGSAPPATLADGGDMPSDGGDMPSDGGDMPSDGGLVDRPVEDSGRFCEKQTNAIYCADFDGLDFGFGWELRGEELGRLERVPSTRSLPYALRAGLLPPPGAVDAGGRGNVYLLHSLGQKRSGIAVDVDIDTDGITAASGGTLVTTATIAFSIDPPAFVSLGFSGEARGVLVVAREVDAGGLTGSEFQRSSKKGFVHYRLETNFDGGTASLFADGKLVVAQVPALRAEKNQVPFVTVGAGADPIATASVAYDNYVVTTLP